MNFIKQKLKADCSPVAITNVLIWLGYEGETEKLRKRIYKSCKTTRIGTFTENIEYALRYYTKPYGKVNKLTDITADLLWEQIKQEKGILLNYLDCTQEWHTAFFYKDWAYYARSTNSEYDGRYLTDKEFNVLIERTNIHGGVEAWSITKKEGN